METKQYRTGGLASWSARRPVSVLMLSLTVLMLGFFSLDELRINLLPHLIYPEVRVRIFDSNVPTVIMEDKVTRQVEEQLAITDGAISIQSSTSEGRMSLDLGFPYGTDINDALRDASTRLDRAKRFLPDTIDPPIIYKRDPQQIPVMEYAVSSTKRNTIALRNWVDYELRNWLINLSGVASAEVGGGTVREYQIILDQEKLARLGLNYNDVVTRIQSENQDIPGGRLLAHQKEISVRTEGRFKNIEDLKQLIIKRIQKTGQPLQLIKLTDIARVIDSHAEERLRIRLNKEPGIKLSIQKQPQANTVEVVETVQRQIAKLKAQNIIPDDINISVVDDQSIFVKHAINNATLAVVSGALLAMIVVYLFLGHLGRTLVIGTAIPLAIFSTFIIMGLGELSLNIMTLGGIALGVGLLVDNTIIMLENINRHQQDEQNKIKAATEAAAEITSAMVASTSTNLAAIFPFLFIGGLVGLLFNELIYTLSAAMLTSLLVATTIVPALSTRIGDSKTSTLQIKTDEWLRVLRKAYINFLTRTLKLPRTFVITLIVLFIISIGLFATLKDSFLPQVDEGLIRVSVHTDPGTQLEDMDASVKKLEDFFLKQKEVDKVFTTSGGFVFGRFQRESSQYSSIKVQLHRSSARETSTTDFVRKMRKKIEKLNLVGLKVWMRVQGVRGIRIGRGSDDFNIRIQGPDVNVLKKLGTELVNKLKPIKEFRNISHNYEDFSDELVVKIDRVRAASLGISIEEIGQAVRLAMNGLVVSGILEDDKEHNIMLKLPKNMTNSKQRLIDVIVSVVNNKIIRLKDVATLKLQQTPSRIKRDNQRRVVEISASINPDSSLSEIEDKVNQQLETFDIPSGYTIFESETFAAKHESQTKTFILVGLALFLVFVVMAIQYESLVNPFVILLGIPFMFIGTTIGLILFGLTVTMPVWLGIIMLSGIVVNNAIVLVEQIELARVKLKSENNNSIHDAIKLAANLRFRPILMTTLTTVIGMLPLAIGLGEGSEMLQPLAIVIVFGLSFSILVSLVLIPIIYNAIHQRLSVK
jgi:multidrug efflux pump subunit AcrB